MVGMMQKIIVYSMERRKEKERERNHCNNPLNSCNLDHQLDIITELLGLGRG